jgi:D-tyrosyl-tRNA(Tyr) deacylase
MRAVVQRVSRASVTVDGDLIGAIGTGLVVLVGVGRTDTVDTAATLARKIHGLRILRGEQSLADRPEETGVLVVSQFTLYGDVRKGRRPSWTAAAPGPVAEPLVAAVAAEFGKLGSRVRTGRFGADMTLELTNDGPVTLLVEF